jgi:hypothetical protein
MDADAVTDLLRRHSGSSEIALLKAS